MKRNQHVNGCEFYYFFFCKLNVLIVLVHLVSVHVSLHRTCAQVGTYRGR